MNNAIIISSSAESTAEIEQLLRNEGIGRIIFFSGGNEARRFIQSDAGIELAVINAPLSDEFGHELAMMIEETSQAKVILICGGDVTDEIARYTAESSVCVMSRPLSRERFSEAVSAFSNYGSSKESAEILSKIEEIRLINSAKATLMKYLKFTEPQAHRYLEKQAMNSRQTRREAAMHILASYDIKPNIK